ncbi:glycosyltransferase family 2 protein [Pedobacter sp. AW31-3R]|uniref:glycosyltransferase family 2 protein n=1 Tax=Pedobacter sp. AW31-3R TaxID=3445781 RepID=UPI003F9F5F12
MAEQMEDHQRSNGGKQDMTDPLVSIIIPSFNYGHLLVETLMSVVNQTYTHWECLVIDDGSTDDTESIMQDFLNIHPDLPVTYIKLPNGGTSAAKNAGIKKAKGEFVQFLDADDLLSTHKLAVQVEILQKTGGALVFSRSLFFTQTDHQVKKFNKYPEGYLSEEALSGFPLLKKLVTNNMFTIGSPLVKTELLHLSGGFINTLRYNEDWLLWFTVALLHPSFYFDHHPDSHVMVRIHGKSAMNKHQQMFLGEIKVREEMDVLLQDQWTGSEAIVLRKLNKDLLALHHVRSVEIRKGMWWIISNFIRLPHRNYKLLLNGGFKLGVRYFKKWTGR